MGLTDRLQHAYNAFTNKDPTYRVPIGGASSNYRPDRPRFTGGNEKSIITSVYNRIALDVSSLIIQHVKLDEDDRFQSVISSGLNNCLILDANTDQTGRAFMQDIVMSMLDEGCVAVTPIDTTIDPNVGSYDVLSMRTGKILDWFPQHVRIRVYNEQTGQKEDVLVPKKSTVIVENPLYAVVNEPNSTLKRLIYKLNILDSIDKQSGSGKLDLIIQLPYVIKTEARRKQAESRRADIENQLSGSQYGIAYTDGTERITQLNRPVENNLMAQIQYLTSMLYSQLGITQGILDGTADETTMLNYYNRTIEPIVSAIVDEMKRKFLTKTARTQKQSIVFFRDPFKLVPVSTIAEIADKFTRNEIASSNEIRQAIGMKPSKDPKADKLENSNIANRSSDADQTQIPVEDQYSSDVDELDEVDDNLDQLEDELNSDGEIKHYASEYYDPAKAHEYYERTKNLKGRTSTSGLSDSGKQAAAYVKQKIKDEHKTKLDQQKEDMMSKIDSIREQLKNMNPTQKILYKERFQKQIDDLRAQNKKAREDLKTEYDEKYAAEVDKIRASKSFIKTKTKSKKSKKEEIQNG